MEGPKSESGPKPRVSVSRESFVAAMRAETEQMLGEVMRAVNDAPDGAWIDASEGEVRDLLGEYRRRVFERALQMRTDAAAGAFSPGGPGDGPAAEEQGPRGAQRPHRQRPRERDASAV